MSDPIFIDGFDHSSALTEKGWTTTVGSFFSVNYDSTTKRTGARSVSINPSNGNSGTGNLYRSIGSNAATVRMAFGYYFSGNIGSSYAGGICAVRDGSSTQVSLVLNTDKTISVYRGTSAGTLLGTTTATVASGVWQHIEVVVTIDPSAGAVTIFLNGISVLALTGQNTRSTANSYATQALLGYLVNPGSSASGTVQFDDFVLSLDATNQIGAAVVQTSYPIAAGSTSNWTRSPAYTDIAGAAFVGGLTKTNISSGGGTLTNAFDNSNTTSVALTGNANAGTAYVGVDFGSDVKIGAYRLYQSTTAANAATGFKVQGSSDGTTWNDVVTVASGAGQDTGVTTFTATTYRYWRILATAGGTSSWTVFTVSFYSYEDWSAAGERPADGDTSYATSSTVGDIDTYTMSNLTSGTTGSILGVAVNVVARDEVGGAVGVAPAIRSNGTNYFGTAVAPTTSYLNYQYLWGSDLGNGGAAWTVSSVNDLEAGVKKTA